MSALQTLDWQPPSTDSQDRYMFGDWRSIRNAIDAAREVLGEPPAGNIPDPDWKLVGLAMTYNDWVSRISCINCQKKLLRYQEIRCLDCKAVLCEQCAPRHFWPNGRPT